MRGEPRKRRGARGAKPQKGERSSLSSVNVDHDCPLELRVLLITIILKDLKFHFLTLTFSYKKSHDMF